MTSFSDLQVNVRGVVLFDTVRQRTPVVILYVSLWYVIFWACQRISGANNPVRCSGVCKSKVLPIYTVRAYGGVEV